MVHAVRGPLVPNLLDFEHFERLSDHFGVSKIAMVQHDLAIVVAGASK